MLWASDLYGYWLSFYTRMLFDKLELPILFFNFQDTSVFSLNLLTHMAKNKYNQKYSWLRRHTRQDWLVKILQLYFFIVNLILTELRFTIQNTSQSLFYTEHGSSFRHTHHIPESVFSEITVNGSPFHHRHQILFYNEFTINGTLFHPVLQRTHCKQRSVSPYTPHIT